MDALYLTILVIAGAAAAVVALLWLHVRRQQIEQGTATSFFPSGKTWWRAGVQLWREEMATNEWHMMQLFAGIAAMAITISIGYIYAGHLLVDGWQLWTWLVTIFVLVATLLSLPYRPRLRLSRHEYWLLALVASALLLRLLFIETIPGLLHVDETGSADFPMRQLYHPDGQLFNPFRTGASSQPALYHFLTRLTLTIFGYSITGIRISSVVAGTLAVVVTYAAVAVFANRRTALLTAALMTTYHYHIQWSRIALNNVWDTLWVPLMLAAFAWGWRRQWSGGAVIAGLAAGLSQYFYAGSKVGVFLLAYVVYALYWQEPDRRRLFVHGGKLVITAVAVAAPITLFAILNPESYFLRTTIVVGWQRDVVVSTVGEYDLWRYFWHQVWHNLGAFTSVSEITGFYGPGVPFLIGLSAPLFLVGVLWSLWKRQWLSVLWILLTAFLGGFLLSGSPSSSHYIVSIPAICWLTAVPLNWLWEKGHWRLALVLLIAVMLTDFIFYFIIYIPGSPRDFIHPLPPLPTG